MIQGYFHGFVGAEAVGTSGHHTNLVVETAVRKQNCYLQIVFRRLSFRLGYAKAIWAIAHRLCRLIWKVLHDGVRYVEHGLAVTPITLKRRRQRLVTELRKLGYQVELTPVQPGLEV